MGAPRVWSKERANEFSEDWLSDMPTADMADKYGFKGQSGVSQRASLFGLPARIGKRGSRNALRDGRWVRIKGVLKWVPDERKSA